MDLTESTTPRSDQQNFDDYVAGPKTVTITDVTAGDAEQPVQIHLAEFPGRPFKPSKSMRRVLVAAWGPDSSVYGGRQMTLYGDPAVKFGGQVVGGIRISHLSHIDKPLKLALTVTRGKRAPFTVQPMPAPAPATPAPEVPHERLSALWQQVADALPDMENAGRVAWIAEEIGRPIERLGELTADEVAKIEAAFTADAGADQ